MGVDVEEEILFFLFRAICFILTEVVVILGCVNIFLAVTFILFRFFNFRMLLCRKK